MLSDSRAADPDGVQERAARTPGVLPAGPGAMAQQGGLSMKEQKYDRQLR